jgi:hypothetical protein
MSGGRKETVGGVKKSTSKEASSLLVMPPAQMGRNTRLKRAAYPLESGFPAPQL